MVEKEIDLTKLNSALYKYKDEKWALIPLLQEVQEIFGYIPPETIEPIADALKLYPAQVQ